MTTFGVNVVSPGIVDTYLNGNFLARYSHTTYSGGYLLLSAHYLAKPHVDRIEVRTAPGGTLLFSDNFTSLSGWSLGAGGADWTINPAGFAYGSTTNSGYGIYITQPSGGNYVELQGVTFDLDGDPDGWVMITPYRVTPTSRSDGGSADGYRTLLRPISAIRPTSQIQVANGTQIAVSGWGVGQIRMGA